MHEQNRLAFLQFKKRGVSNGNFCLFKNTYYAYFQFYLRGSWFKTLKSLGKSAFLVKKRGVFNGSFYV